MALTHSEKIQISQRYASAIFDITQQAGEADATLEALLALTQASTVHPELASAMHNPLMAQQALSDLFSQLLDKVKAPKSAHQAVALLVANGRIALLSFVTECLQARLDTHNNVLRGELVSATALDDAAVAAIAEDLSNPSHRVALSHRVDASLIGGLRLHLGSRMMDASVSGQLARLKRHLLHSASQETTA